MSLKIVYTTIIILLLTNIYFIFLNNNKNTNSVISSEIKDEIKITKRKSLVQDFYYYNCKKMERIGGSIYSTNKQERVEGGWFVCLDKLIAPRKNDCNVLSFGINTDESFDYEMNNDFKCNVYSFDPIVEADRFQQIRNSNKNLKNSIMIPVNDKWKFYRIGVTGSKDNVRNKNELGWIETLDNILKITNLENKIIDIFKMDIEVWINENIVGIEQNVFEHLNIDYACKYFKQILIETHSSNLKSSELFDLLKRIGKCFSLFHRDTRLIGPNYGGEVFKDAAIKSLHINLAHFENEIYLINFLLSTGELYFVNENFLSK
jgi:hypothetical protein